MLYFFIYYHRLILKLAKAHAPVQLSCPVIIGLDFKAQPCGIFVLIFYKIQKLAAESLALKSGADIDFLNPHANTARLV